MKLEKTMKPKIECPNYGFIVHINGNFHGYFYNKDLVNLLQAETMFKFQQHCTEQFDNPVFETFESIEKEYTSKHTETISSVTWLCKKTDGSWDELCTFQISKIKWIDHTAFTVRLNGMSEL